MCAYTLSLSLYLPSAFLVVAGAGSSCKPSSANRPSFASSEVVAHNGAGRPAFENRNEMALENALIASVI